MAKYDQLATVECSWWNRASS